MKRIKRDIIDNADDTGNTMAKILNSEIHSASRFDVSTGYFDVPGYALLREQLESAAKGDRFQMRLMMGKEAILPREGSFEKYAQKYAESSAPRSVKSSIDGEDISRENLDATASLIGLLQRDNIHVRLGADRFNHSKCYIFDGDHGDCVFIGSSNLTGGGLTGNHELNAGLYQPGAAEATRRWFDRMWDDAAETKKDLIKVLEQSKFGIPPEPYQVYMKILFEKHKHFLEPKPEVSYSKKLTEFQAEAVRNGMTIIGEFGGAMIADATGLGKTNMGIEIVRQKVLKEGKRVLLIAPAQVLHSMWEEKLKEVDINVRELLTTESLGRESILEGLGRYRNVDLVLIDESHNFRSKGANRRKNLMKLLSVGRKKQVVLLSATPINNSLMDLYYQLSIITGGDDTYFYRQIGIPDLYKHMRDAANKDLEGGLEKIQQLLDSVMVRRTRSYIREIYPDDEINGQPIRFPDHQYSPIKYSLADLFGNIFEKVLNNINALTMAPYGLERYRTDASEEEKSKHRAAAHLQVILLLKRFESSKEAVRASLANKINLYEYIHDVFREGKILRVRDFNRIMAKWSSMDLQDGDGEGADDERQMRFFLDEIRSVPKDPIGKNYDTVQFNRDMESDLALLKELFCGVEKITVDTKLQEVIHTILRERATTTESKKVLIFTEYMATARYITSKLKEAFRHNTVECITGNTRQETRKSYIRRFAPKSNLIEDERLDQDEIDILVSTEVLSEGQNLQDCNYVISYDLPWNPMKIVQRTGRIDRLTSTYDTIHTRACYPDDALDQILQIMGKLMDKIRVFDTVIGGDSEILGELPNPKTFNGTTAMRLRALARAGDASAAEIITRMEQESDVMPSISPINEISKHVKKIGIEQMQEVQMGRRSGKRGEGQKAVLAYLEERPDRRVYMAVHDFGTGHTAVPEENVSVQLLSCTEDTPTHLPMDGPSNRESFELLLDLDVRAREAIRRNNDQMSAIKAQLDGKKRDQHKRTTAEVSKIIMDAVMDGRLAKEAGNEIYRTVRSEYVKPWDDTLRDLVLEYNRTQDVDGVVRGIKKLEEFVGLSEKAEPAREAQREQGSKLRLVGAMFVTGEGFKGAAKGGSGQGLG